MITPRETRLVRVADPHEFRRMVAFLCEPDVPSRIVVVPTRSAAATLESTLAARRPSGSALPVLVTRDEVYDALLARLATRPRRLSVFERDAMMQSAALEAARGSDLPFSVRPGLVSEMLRFYDQLRRQSQQVKRFEELIADALGGDVDDRGAERLLRQTRFLAAAFVGYERRASASDGVDEHRLREWLLSAPDAEPLAHVIVTVPDWIAEPAGLFVADFDLFNRLPHLAAIDIVSTDAVLRSGFHERLHQWWPGLDEVGSAELAGPAPRVRPALTVPPPVGADAPALWFSVRDREEELIAIARDLAAVPGTALARQAIVFKRPLPYLYLATDTLGALDIPFAAGDALPLAAEPAAAALDLVLDAVEADFPRASIVALLRSPHFIGQPPVARDAVFALDVWLAEARYLGGADRFAALDAMLRAHASDDRRRPSGAGALAAYEAAAPLVADLARLQPPRPASEQLRSLAAWLSARFAPLGDAASDQRESRARTAILEVLDDLAAAHAAHHDPPWTAADLAAAVRRWLGERTFAVESAASGVRLLDDQAARYGDFDAISIVGLVDTDWPDRPRRNIFYPPALLKSLGWPSEKDRHAAADARFLDLLSSPSREVRLFTFQLDDEAIVSRSLQLDEVPRAGLSTTPRALPTGPLMPDERLALDDNAAAGTPLADEWLDLRRSRTGRDDPAFHGAAGQGPAKPWSVSALETYVSCPFRFFAQHVLRLEEEPDDDETMNPLQQGLFVHEVFERFFRAWQDAGHRAITADNLDDARTMFTSIVDRALDEAPLPEGEAALERTRLLGSPAAAGLGEAVFRMEAERPVPVVARLLEHRLEQPVSIQTDDGTRTVTLRGKADRIDLLEDGTFRLIDYKLGWPPDRNRALQLPIYALSAEQHLRAQGRRWSLGEAVYLAFKGPKRVVPLFANDAAKADVMARAQQRLADALDGIARGEFPPSPDDVFQCDRCGFSSVCRKDYVGDV